MFMCQNIEEKPKIWLKDLDDHYATFTIGNKCAAVRLDKMPEIAEGVYKVEVLSMLCIVDTNIPISEGGRAVEVIS